MADVMTGLAFLVLVVLAYWAGWVERGEHDAAMRNVDKLAHHAFRSISEGSKT